eukprot:TRINITY_DN26392_c0_g1_i2.p1 TRINITY_DN26392_c0_g1~~TRINITY_DN26392_c0_g1_i2.p1  ORF type:complete len:442 (+),score=138.99 TRINITY_DN26392_c0_g1_i2:194-1519(+)
MAAAHDKDTGRVLHKEKALYQEYMTGLGGLERFIALSKSESLAVRRSASLGLLNLSFAVLNSHEIIAREGVQAVLRNMHDEDDEVRANGVWTLVNLLINPRNHIYCKNEETLRLVIDLMKHHDSNTRFWALRCVCNFCLGTGATQVQLAKLGVLPPIIDVLQNEQPEKGHATDARMKFFGLACLSNLTSKNNHVENMIAEMGIEILFELTQSSYPNIPAEAAKVITNLAVQNQDNQRKMVESGGFVHMLPLCESESDACQYQAACALLNILQHPTAKTKVFDHDGLDYMYKLLVSEKNEIQRKAAAMLTVLAESEECRQKISAHKEAASIKSRLMALSEAGDLNNFDSLMARVRASQALSALEDDNHTHYKKTVLQSIEDVLAKFQFADAPAVDNWNRDYANIKENDIDLSLIHISEPTRLLSISYAVFCLKKKKKKKIIS